MKTSSGRFSTRLSSLLARVFVLIASWLHIAKISFFAILMRPNSVTSTPFVVSAQTRVCVSASLNNFRTFRFSLLQHIPSHTCALSPTPTSAHAFTINIITYIFLILENIAVHQVSRLVIPGNAGYPGLL